jgi:hypothetical protein
MKETRNLQNPRFPYTLRMNRKERNCCSNTKVTRNGIQSKAKNNAQIKNSVEACNSL